MDRPHLDYEQRVRVLRKRLALDFQPLRDTLSRGLDVLIDPEAAVLCTATVEALCDALFNVVIKNLHEEAASSFAPLDTKVTIYHIQVALRSHADFAQLLQCVESASAVLECFMDATASRALYQRHLIATREAKHLRTTQPATAFPSSGGDSNELLPTDDELIALHERTRSEWQKREDDPFTDVDFAMVLKCVHPAFTLAYSATLLLSALVRELLNEVCDRANVESVQRRVPPELYVEDLAAPLAHVFHVGDVGRQIERSASECLERFRLRSRQRAALTLRCRVFSSGANAAQSVKHAAAHHALPSVPRDARFAQLLPQMCKKCHLDVAATVAVYRGHQVDGAATPAALSMPTGAVVFLVPKKWWAHTRRNEARRGLLSSLRPQDAHVKSLVESTASRVKRELQGSSPTADASGSNPFGFLAPAVVLPPRRDEHWEPKRTQEARRLGDRASVHAASASRLMGVGGGGARRMEKEVRGRKSDGEEEADSEDKDEHDGRSGNEGEEEGDDDDEPDSLTRLLQQRQRLRREKRAAARENNNAQRSPVQRRGGDVTRRELVETLARQSTQLMDTLDEAWLGFAGISASVRTIKDTLLSQFQDELDKEERSARGRGGGGGGGGEGGGGGSVSALEQELRVRLEKTGELVRQTAVAHDLVAQLLHGARRLRSGVEQPHVGHERR